ncbi:MAG: biotin/lipoyl-containing protein, partial [Betaproteobacteria bacterium]
MALIEVKVPQLSESVAEATLLQWHKKPGDAVARDENLIDVETDKVVLELPAPSAGVLVSVIKGDGSTVVSGEVIATKDTEATAGAAPAPAKPTAASTPAATAPSSAKSGVAMPAAAKMMAEAGLSASQVSGSGRDGRITKGDVIGAVAAGTQASAAAPAAAASVSIPTGAPTGSLPAVKAPVDVARLTEGRPEQRAPMSRLRQRVAERLLQSQATNAILTTFH